MMQSSGQNQGHQTLLEAHLRALNLPAFLQSYQAYARNSLSADQFLLGLCEAEMANRDTRRIETAIGRGKFPFLKEIAEYGLTAVVSIPKTTILALPPGGYMSQAANLILVGHRGLGKTHSGTGLALPACRQGKPVCFSRAAARMNDLHMAQKKRMLHVFVIITSNLRWSDWHVISSDDGMTTAFPERLTHKGRVVAFVDDLYRYRHRLQQTDPVVV